MVGHIGTLWLGSELRLGTESRPGDRAESIERSALELTFAPEDLIAPPTQSPELLPPPDQREPSPPVPVAQTPPPPAPVPLKPEREEIRLGIAKSSQNSPNWIGYADPTPHAASKSEVEQAALDPNAGPALTSPGSMGEQGPQSSPEAEAAPAAQSPPQDPQPPQPTPAEAAPSAPAAEPAMSLPPKSVPEAPMKPLPEGPLMPGGEVDRAFVGPREASDALAPDGTAPPEPSPASTRGTAPKPAEATVSPEKTSADSTAKREKPNLSAVDRAATPAPSVPASQPRPLAPSAGAGADAPSLPGTTGQAAERSGEKSDRESDASSLEEALIVLPGRPAAAEGLEIITRRPTFSRYVRTVASPNNPVFRVTFGRNGQVLRASLLQSSGYKDVDDPVYNALLSWRATGQKLDQLPIDDTEGLSITMKVVLR